MLRIITKRVYNPKIRLFDASKWKGCIRITIYIWPSHIGMMLYELEIMRQDEIRKYQNTNLKPVGWLHVASRESREGRRLFETGFGGVEALIAR